MKKVLVKKTERQISEKEENEYLRAVAKQMFMHDTVESDAILIRKKVK